MKILLLIRYFDFGGAENHVLDLANYLHELGHSVVLVSRKGRQYENLKPGITYYQLNLSSRKSAFHFVRLLQIIRYHRIDIIHAHQRLPLIISSALARIVRIPVVGTVHSMLRQDVKRQWVRKGFKKVIVVSGNSFKGTQNDPILRTKCVCIPNGIHLPDEIRTSQPEKLHFYYVSRLDIPHSILIRFLLNEVWPSVIQKYPKAQLSIVGDGLGMPEIQRTVSKIHTPSISKSISLKGYVRKISSEIADASLVFGVGRVALESMAMGIPVLSVKSNRLGSIITSKNFEKLQYGNFVDVEASPPEKNAFLRIIDDFVDNQDFYKKEAIRLQPRIMNTFHIENVIQATVQVYNELVLA